MGFEQQIRVGRLQNIFTPDKNVSISAAEYAQFPSSLRETQLSGLTYTRMENTPHNVAYID